MELKEMLKLNFLAKQDASKTLRYMVAVRIIDETFRHIGPIFSFLKSRLRRRHVHVKHAHVSCQA